MNHDVQYRSSVPIILREFGTQRSGVEIPEELIGRGMECPHSPLCEDLRYALRLRSVLRSGLSQEAHYRQRFLRL